MQNQLVFVLMLLTSLYVSLVRANDVYTLSVDQWDRPHDAKSISELAPLPDVISAWSQQEDAKIDIRYPGGEMGELLARRLHDWLVILGVPSSEILLTPGSAVITQLELIVK